MKVRSSIVHHIVVATAATKSWTVYTVLANNLTSTYPGLQESMTDIDLE